MIVHANCILCGLFFLLAKGSLDFIEVLGEVGGEINKGKEERACWV